MLISAESYYDDTRMMDIRIMGSLGLTDDDLADLLQIEGIESAYGGYTADVFCSGDEQRVVRLIAYLDQVNLPTVAEGRLPDNMQECFVDSRFLETSGYQIGDTISFKSGDETELDSILACNTFRIVGCGHLPYYMDLSRGTGTIGNGKLQGFVLVKPEAFALDYYTEIYICLVGAKLLNSYDEAYK